MTTGTGQSIRRSHFGEHDNPSEVLQLTPVLTFDKLVTFSNVGGANEFASTVIAALPVGDFQIFGGVLHLDVFESTAQANLIDTFAVSYSLGTTATADNTLSGTDVDLLTLQTSAAASGGVAPHQVKMLDGTFTLPGGTAAGHYVPNNDGSKEVNLNMTILDASISGAVTLRVRGTLQFSYVAYGKNS